MNPDEIKFDEPIRFKKAPLGQKEKKKKKEKSVWEKMWSQRKLKKNNTVAALYLRENGMAEPMICVSKNGFFNVYGKVYHERRDCVWTMSKDRIPLILIPEWSLVPVGTKQWQDKSMLEKFAELQDHVLKGIRHAEIVKLNEGKEGMKINPKVAIILLIVAIIGFAVLKNYM